MKPILQKISSDSIFKLSRILEKTLLYQSLEPPRLIRQKKRIFIHPLTLISPDDSPLIGNNSPRFSGDNSPRFTSNNSPDITLIEYLDKHG